MYPEYIEMSCHFRRVRNVARKQKKQVRDFDVTEFSLPKAQNSAIPCIKNTEPSQFLGQMRGYLTCSSAIPSHSSLIFLRPISNLIPKYKAVQSNLHVT